MIYTQLPFLLLNITHHFVTCPHCLYHMKVYNQTCLSNINFFFKLVPDIWCFSVFQMRTLSPHVMPATNLPTIFLHYSSFNLNLLRISCPIEYFVKCLYNFLKVIPFCIIKVKSMRSTLTVSGLTVCSESSLSMVLKSLTNR